jgi:hypothetical protein
MKEEKNNYQSVWIIVGLLLIIFGFYFNKLPKNDTDKLETKKQIKVTSLQVTKFYDGDWGYSLSIPDANNSTCIWTWVAGNDAIPDSRTTSVNRNTTEKHFVKFGDYIDAQWDYKVSCVDDFGNNYIGVFPVEK